MMVRLGLAFLAGSLAGARTMSAPAALSWAARSGRVAVAGTKLAALAHPTTTAILTAAAAGELVGDKLPIGSRTSSVQLSGRLLSGALCGAAIGLPRDPVAGLLVGMAGAAAGAFTTAALRTALARRLGADLPAALLEDAAAMTGAVLLRRSV